MGLVSKPTGEIVWIDNSQKKTPNLQAVTDAMNAALNSQKKTPNLQAVTDAMNAALEWKEQNSSSHANSQYVDIYIKEKNGSREIRIPWLPDEIDYKSGEASVATFDIIKKGPVDIPLGVGLKEVSWQSIFPGTKRTGLTLLRGTASSPDYYHNILEDWKAKGTDLEIMVTSTPVNFDCYLKDYTGKFTGAFGDIEYEVQFVEKRKIVISTAAAASSGGSEETADSDSETERPAEETTSYTIKAGDSMWAIAQQYLGDGSRWEEVYELNKDALDKAAADMGHSSNNGTWIFPGTTIKLPQSA